VFSRLLRRQVFSAMDVTSLALGVGADLALRQLGVVLMFSHHLGYDSWQFGYADGRIKGEIVSS